MESLSTRRRRPLKPATLYGWQHCLDRWILPNLGNKLVSEVGNGALRQFVEILTAARLAPKTIVNVVTVAKFVVASAVDEEGDQIHPRVWNYEFIQLPLVIKEKQKRPHGNGNIRVIEKRERALRRFGGARGGDRATYRRGPRLAHRGF